MVKHLRLLLVSALAVVCGTAFAETTVKFDFTTDTSYTMFGLSGFSNGDGATDGDITEAKSATIDGVTLTVSESGAKSQNRMWGAKTNTLRVYGGTITITSSSEAITAINFNASKWNDGNTTDVGTLDSKKWTGSATTVVLTIAANTQLKDIEVTLGGSSSDDDDDPVDPSTLPTAENIAAFCALTDGTEAILTLSNVEVLWASGNDMYVRDNSGATNMFKTGFSYTTGQILNGSVIGKDTTYYDVQEFIKTSNTNTDNITATTGGDPEAKAIDAAEFNSYLCDLITITGKLSIDGKNYYITDEDGNKIQVYDKYSVGNLTAATEGNDYTVVGIATLYKSNPEILLTKAITDEEVKTTTVDNIAAFKALDQNAVAELTLTDAQVLYAYNKDIYVRDATGALDLYNTGLEFTQNQILNGTITGTNTLFKNLPELADMTANTLTATDGSAAEPVSVTMSTVQNELYLNDLVKLTEVTVDSIDGKAYAVDGDTQVQIYDKFKVLSKGFTSGEKYTLTGILIIYNSTWEICPTEERVSTGIETINAAAANAPVYNIAGQRVNNITKSGIYLKNGHKYLIKK